MRRLPAEIRLLLAVAAAEPTASEALLWQAAGELGIDPDAAAAADLGGLAEIGSRWSSGILWSVRWSTTARHCGSAG